MWFKMAIHLRTNILAKWRKGVLELFFSREKKSNPWKIFRESSRVKKILPRVFFSIDRFVDFYDGQNLARSFSWVNFCFTRCFPRILHGLKKCFTGGKNTALACECNAPNKGNAPHSIRILLRFNCRDEEMGPRNWRLFSRACGCYAPRGCNAPRKSGIHSVKLRLPRSRLQ